MKEYREYMEEMGRKRLNEVADAIVVGDKGRADFISFGSEEAQYMIDRISRLIKIEEDVDRKEALINTEEDMNYWLNIQEMDGAYEY